MKQEQLNEVLRLHLLWLRGSKEGEQANLRGANLRGANLQGANLEWADLQGANLQWVNLQWVNLRDVNLQGANLQEAQLQWANLQGAKLQGAKLQGANLDYSCWPLWCGSMNVKVDRRLAAQLAAHFCVLDCDDQDYQKAREAIMPFAKTCHRARDLGLI